MATLSSDSPHDSPPTNQQAIEKFLASLAMVSKTNIHALTSALEMFPNGPGQELNDLLLPSFETEKILRTAFPMAKRHSDTFPDPLVGLIDLFSLPSGAQRTQIPPKRVMDTLSPRHYNCPIPALRAFPSQFLFPLPSHLRRQQRTQPSWKISKLLSITWTCSPMVLFLGSNLVQVPTSFLLAALCWHALYHFPIYLRTEN